MIRKKRLTLTAMILFAGSCALQQSNKRSRPTDQTEDLPGYLDSVEKDIVATEGGTVTIGSTTTNFPINAAASDYRVRLSRNVQTPTLSDKETSVLGSPQSDIVTVEVYDLATKVILSSDQLLAPYEFKQTFSTSSSTDKIGLMVVSDAGTASEQRVLLPNSELTVSTGTSLSLSGASSSVTVSVFIKLTNAVVWLVPYTEDALKILTVGDTSSLASIGGTTASSAVTTVAPSSIPDASLSINSGSSYTKDASVSLTLTATGAAQMYVTGTSGCTADGSWESFSETKAWTLTSLNAVSRVYAKFKGSDGGESACVSGSIIHDDILPSAPATLNDGTTNASLLSSPTLSWALSTDAGSGISRYEIALGTVAGGTSVKTWTAVGNTGSSMVSGLSLTADVTYFASVRAVDAAGNNSLVTEGDGWTATNSSFNCPTNYVAIPANGDLGTAQFCVMKYEAKSVGGIAVSQAAGLPRTMLARGTNSSSGAWKACKDLGADYDLLTNAQWQAIARNIEGVSSNWSNGSKSGSNSLNRGNYSINQGAALVADVSDSNGCAGITSNGDPADNCGNAWHLTKRTHTLSNGQVIWDIAGNVWEWVQDNLTSQGANRYVSQMTAGLGYNMLRWGPAGDFTAKNSPEYGGLGYASLNSSGGGVIRGGAWNSDAGAGIFTTELSETAATAHPDIGFRCTAVGGP